MKKKIKLLIYLLLALLLTNTAFAQEGWVQQTSGTICKLYSVSFGNENTGCVVGVCPAGGTILNTTNGGLQWFTNSYSRLSSVQLIDENTGWAVGGDYYGGRIIKTTDGGLNWNSQVLLENDFFSSVYFIDENIGFASGVHIDLNTYGTVFRTTNGGEDWFRKLSLYGSEILWSVYFLNQNLGWVAGQYGKIQKTTDGGSQWIEQNVDDSYDLRSVFFVDENNGWVVGKVNWPGLTLNTTNGGLNWSLISLDSVSFTYLYDVQFIDVNNGWIVGADGKIFKTTDAGISWNVQNSGTAFDLHSVDFIDQNTGWVVGDEGTILHTSNGGVTFIEELIERPNDFFLAQNYPNPFNPSTKIKYSIPSVETHRDASLQVKLIVYDVLGNEVATLVNEHKPAGSYEVEFDGSDLTSGIYFYQLQADSFIETKKMILLK
jgi:photosystem II stability/assembly factor-like uncharacterized protein